MLRDLYARLLGKRKPQSGTDPGAQLSYATESGSMATDDLSYAAIAATNAADFGQAEKLCQKLLNYFPYVYDGVSVHLFTSLGQTIPPELAELRRRQMLAISSIQDSDSAIAKARVAREHLQEIISKCAVISQKNFAFKGGTSGSLDAEVAAVLTEYEARSEPVTIDEVVGIAVARIYARLRLAQFARAGDECLHIVTRGRFAIAETGNCAVDCVFDPRLRAVLWLKARARGGSLGDLLSVEKAYGEVSSIDPAGGVVRTVLLKDTDRLRLLPEHALHSVVLAYNTGSCGHAVRIAALGDNGIWAMEGNYDGALRVGRFVPFSELTTASGQIVLLHRRPIDRFGLFSDAPDDLSTDTELLTALEGVMAKTGKTEFFKVEEAMIRHFVDNPAMWHQMASIVGTLPVLRMRTVTAYDMVRQEDVVAAVPFLGGHKTEEVVERWLDYAANSPTGLIVAFGPSEIGKSLGGRSRLPESVMREIGAPQDPEGRHYLPLDTLTEIVRKHDSKKHTEDRRYEFGLVHGLTRQQFADLDEDLKNQTWILTPQTADDGTPVVVERCWELHEMKILADQPGVLASAGAGSESVSIFDLLSNPLRSLVIVGLRIFLQPFVGTECEVSSAERDVINSVGIFLRDRSD